MRRYGTRLGGGILLLLLAVACAHSSWEQARALDTLAGYSQFIRDHPRSQFVNDAQERMAFLRVTTYKTLESFEEFEERYPKSQYMGELRELVEPLYFEVARAENTPQAYSAFLARYPQGNLSARAVGNRVYVSQVLPGVSEAALRGFVQEHPASDYVGEARRTVELLELQRKSRVRSLGVRVDVSPNVRQPLRVRQGFASLFAQLYAKKGVEVSLIEPDAAPAAHLDGWANVEYREAPATGVLGGATLVAHCRVRIYHRDLEEPVWDRRFEAPADHLIQGAYGRDKTIFASSKYGFWERFFVPLATWAVSEVEVQRREYHERVQAVDVRGDRAALLLERGGVDFLDISSPPAAEVVERYRREVDLAEWWGVSLLNDDTAVTFGTDGMEIVRRGKADAERVAKFEGPAVGSVRAAALYNPATLLFGGSQGLFALRLNRSPLVPQRLLDGEVRGIAMRPPYVVVVRRDRVEVALPKHLMLHLTEKKTSLGGFRVDKARVIGDDMFLLGSHGVLHMSLANPQQPRVTGMLEPSKVGRIVDIGGDGEQLYLLGERGLQVAVVGRDGVQDFIQVDSRQGLATFGRFALLVGAEGLEVLDLSPYALRDWSSEPEVRPAAPAPSPVEEEANAVAPQASEDAGAAAAAPDSDGGEASAAAPDEPAEGAGADAAEEEPVDFEESAPDPSGSGPDPLEP